MDTPRATATTKAATLVGLPALLAGGVVLFFFDPARSSFYPTCLFHRITGWDCPTCGSTRAVYQLLHGNFNAALHFNAFIILSLPVFMALGFEFFRRKFTRRPPMIIRTRWMWFYGAALVAFGIWRNLPFPLCASFAP